MRGRLIFPFLAGLRRLDTSATEAAGYDDRFRAPNVSYPTGPSGPRQTTRRELDEVRVACQVEPVNMDQQRQMPSGNVPDTRIQLVFHFRRLELAGLVATDGQALIHVNDRLGALYTMRGVLEREFTDPELFATEVREIGYGLSGGRRNLLLVTFQDRPQGLTGQP